MRNKITRRNDSRQHGRQAVSGLSVGILVIDVSYPLVSGNVANASTFNFPVVHRILEGTTIEQILRGDAALGDMIITAGKELVARYGVRAIVGACGSFANYQKDVAAALDVPVFMSVMLQAPLIISSLKPDQKLGVLAASASALTPRVFEQCGIVDASRLAIKGAEDLPEFQKLCHYKGDFDNDKLQMEIVELVEDMVNANPEIGSLLIQCSDLPPYAEAIQRVTGLPVFDMNGLIEWAYHAIVRRSYAGFV